MSLLFQIFISEHENVEEACVFLKNKGIELNRKVMADMAMNDPDAFSRLVENVK